MHWQSLDQGLQVLRGVHCSLWFGLTFEPKDHMLLSRRQVQSFRTSKNAFIMIFNCKVSSQHLLLTQEP